MGKASLQRQLPENEAKAVGRMIRTSPQKLNLVAQLIRGKKAEQALNDLTFSRRRVSGDVKKVLQSAIANAENNHIWTLTASSSQKPMSAKIWL